MAKVLIIGGGFAGCIAADMLSAHDVTLVESANHLGGGCVTRWHGGHPYTFGPRHFLTKRQDVWDYLDKLCPLRRFPGHEFLTYVPSDEEFYHFPICADEVEGMEDAPQIRGELAAAGVKSPQNLEEYWLQSVGPTLYGKFVKNYSEKMWGGIDNRTITDFGFTPKGVAIKAPGANVAAWSEALSGFPLAADGYNSVFPKMTQKAKVVLGRAAELDIENKRARFQGDWITYDIIVSTISPEMLFRQCFGALRWMGREFLPVVMPVKMALPKDVFFLYYAGNEPHTRIVEYKKFYQYKSPHTLIGIEIPSTKNKLYPFPTTEDQAAAQKYLDLLPEGVFSIGRMGSYRYLDVGMIIEQCFDMKAKV